MGQTLNSHRGPLTRIEYMFGASGAQGKIACHKDITRALQGHSQQVTNMD